ncbi:hypothetical protein GCM10007354_18580 [Acinetobacter courvalinii]|uniref:Uncharacterized protein n=1 Tax=Acinetobacter courvalinii TaxID=280147 RepID=A0ABD0A7H3_9GAMM|nr:hypothetical protein GCM10007354_18580 [Acinetobacter courvalinii]
MAEYVAWQDYGNLYLNLSGLIKNKYNFLFDMRKNHRLNTFSHFLLIYIYDTLLTINSLIVNWARCTCAEETF